MIVKITSKRQVTFPARVLDALGVGPGDHLELDEGPDGFPPATKAHPLLPSGHIERQDTNGSPAVRHRDLP